MTDNFHFADPPPNESGHFAAGDQVAPANDAELMATPVLQSAVRSLRRWSLATAVLLGSLAGMWLLLLIVQGVSVIITAVKFGDGYEMAAGFAFGMFLSGSILCVFVGLPAWLVLMSSRRAADALRTGRLQPIVRSLIWLRRFLVVCTLGLLGYVAMVVLFTMVDFTRFFGGDSQNPYAAPLAGAEPTDLDPSEDADAVLADAAKEAGRALPWLMIMIVLVGLFAGSMLATGISFAALASDVPGLPAGALLIALSLCPAVVTIALWRTRSAIVGLQRDSTVNGLSLVLSRSGMVLAMMAMFLGLVVVIQAASLIVTLVTSQ